jgi:ubiquinone/menaquinone biosynthesis C-methylase UbiE
MPDSDINVTKYNRKAWDHVADQGDDLYHAMTPEQIELAKAGTWRIRVTPTVPVPHDWILPVAGKKVLCLAAGGGQQAPILAALGADVTVADLSEKQLQRDVEVAQREGLAIETVNADMAAMPQIADASFDLVINPCSVIFCPDVRPVWAEVHRVLKPGGRFITGFINPIYYLFDAAKMDKGKLKARNKIPYSDLQLSAEQRAQLIGPDRPLEFGHSLADLIAGQLEAGFQISGFYEDRWGDDDRLSELIDVFIATMAVK